jgi:hypothetical protein
MWSSEAEDWSPKSRGSFVRRRRWIRHRVLKTHQEKTQDRVEEIQTEEDWEIAQLIETFVSLSPKKSRSKKKKKYNEQQREH